MEVDEFLDYKRLLNIIESHAKYQKIMIIYDNSVSNTLIDEIYFKIRDNCVFNKCNIKEDLNIIYDGYKLLIFLCSTDSYLKLNLRLDEFVCVFMPTDDEMLPYFLNKENSISQQPNFLFIKRGAADAKVIPSVYFNQFYNYINQLIFMQGSSVQFNFQDFSITQKSLINILKSLPADFKFYDIEIIRRTNLTYNQLPLLDYVLICALCCFIRAVQSNSLALVDVYKLAGDNYDIVNKYYAMANGGLVVNVVGLNAHCLLITANKTREKILQNISYYSKQEVEEVINCVKNYAKTEDGLLSYLYLYNLFDL